MLAVLHKLPLNRKLTVVGMVACVSALVVVAAAFAFYENYSSRRGLVRDLSITAAMIGTNCSAALTFDEAGSAQITLESLKAHPHVLAAVLYDRTGNPFVRYARAPQAHPVPPIAPGQPFSFRFTSDSLELWTPVILDSENIGTVFLTSDLGEIRERLARYAVTLLGVFLVATFVALLLGNYFRRLITAPLFNLAEVAKTVADQKDYSLRAVRTTDDEIGQLVDSFNHMLQQVQARDHALRDAQAQLENRVIARTADLTTSMEELQQEIAERKRMAGALRASENFLQSLVESIPQYIIRKDLEGRYTFVNERFCQAHGRSRAQIIGRTAAELYPPEIAARFDLVDRELLAGGRQTESEETFVTSLHGTFEAHVIRTPVFDSDGGACGVQIVFWDITARKKAEAELAQAHRELLETSRLAGMAEVASSVLHNVGNVLNSVNVSATLVTERIANSRIPSLSKLATLLSSQTDLAAFFTQDPRGPKVPSFLADLVRHIQAEHAAIAGEIEALRKNIEHIKDIVVMQQGYARISGLTETLPPAEIMEHALRITGADRTRANFYLSKAYQDGPPILTERPKVLQILVNLLRNARQSLAERGGSGQMINVRIERDRDGRARFIVEDNGVGIPPENLERIFSHGFTTKKDGHGFGLHSSAIAAREIGGVLHAHSAGAGRGARFTLDLPAQIPAKPD